VHQWMGTGSLDANDITWMHECMNAWMHIWNEMKWHEMTWNEFKWHELNEGREEGRNEMKGTYIV